jgi:hypothetical protein
MLREPDNRPISGLLLFSGFIVKSICLFLIKSLCCKIHIFHSGDKKCQEHVIFAGKDPGQDIV